MGFYIPPKIQTNKSLPYLIFRNVVSCPGRSEYFVHHINFNFTILILNFECTLCSINYVNYGLISFVFVDVSLFFWFLNVVCLNLRLWLFFIFVHLRMNKNENLVIELRSMLYKHSTSNFMLLPNRWNGQSLTFSIAIFLDFVVFTVCLVSYLR